ncbi:MAG TPA: hypothetical protein VKB86_07410, partial [Pyrinomonadaceae bacterium]|nr:hypothetical protein [Pyrinomonadaceae bacterium]
MFRKADRLNAVSLRRAIRAVVALLFTLMLYASPLNTVAYYADSCNPPCPTISISCPTDHLVSGMLATVNVKLSGGDSNMTVTYNWTVSA